MKKRLPLGGLFFNWCKEYLCVIYLNNSNIFLQINFIYISVHGIEIVLLNVFKSITNDVFLKKGCFF